ncbi:Cysteine desulfurase [Minicystis rosea]|nr:Cysteine desulfurase [Minicystis rosea]
MTTTFTAKLGDRSLFPDLAGRVYVNHASISPPSLAVRRAVMGVLDDYAAHGSGSFGKWAAQRSRLREKLAKLVGARAEDIALMPNTTRGVSDVALCFPWSRGDRVILFEGEFPANVTPWQRAAEAFGLEIAWVAVADFLASEEQGLEALRRELSRGARLVAVSAVEFQNGLRMPIAEMAKMAHAAGAELFVDAVQACGIVPIDVVQDGIDYLAAGSHKWLMGPEGGGFLYVSPDRIDALRPNVAGWLSHEDPIGFLLRGPGLLRYDRPIRRRADLFEGGNVNTAGLAGLEAAVDLIQHVGARTIFEHVTRILDALEPALVGRGFASLRSADPRQRSGALSVRPPAGISLVELGRELGSRGISCSTPDGLLRFSPHWPNSVDQVPEVLAGLDASLASLRR